MSDKKAACSTYKALATAMERKARELQEALVKTGSNERAVRSKYDKLLCDKSELEKLVTSYVGTLSDETDTVAIDEVYDKHGALLERVNQALEAATEYLEEEEYKLTILKNTQEVEQDSKSIQTQLAKIKDKTDFLKAGKHVLTRESYEIFIEQLEALAAKMDEAVVKYRYLVLHDTVNRADHQENLAQVDKYKEDFLDLKLVLCGALEKKSTSGDPSEKEFQLKSDKLQP